jgi:hypothetical protein
LVFAVVGLCLLLVTIDAPTLKAGQDGGLPALERRVVGLESLVASLMQANADQAEEITALMQRLVDAEGRLVFVTVEGSDMFITGANLHIRNGLEATNGNPADPRASSPAATLVNGLGNLIVGYNAPGGISGETSRQGSHNLVIGDFNYYSSFGGIVAGRDNVTLAPYASTLGGRSNRAEAVFSAVVGGAFNVTDGNTTAVLGGNANRASDIDATVCGGNANWANARFAVVGGGNGVAQSNEFGWSAGSFGAPAQGAFVSP